MDNANQLLKDVIETQNIERKSAQNLFLNAGFSLDNSIHYQPFAPLSPNQTLPDINGAYANVFICGTKHVKETQFYISLGLKYLKEDGYILVAADNKENGKRLEKWFQETGLNPVKFSAHKAQCVIAQKNTGLNSETIQEWYNDGKVQKNSDGFYAQPGLFSYNKIDRASKLLIEQLTEPLKGDVADFGCGYGYLSVSALNKENKIKSLYGYDADARALKCYEQNLEEKRFHTFKTVWCDLGKPYKAEKLYDIILMNPPFHEGRKDTPELGISFLKNAANALRRKGVLWMVANKHLPYEKTLEKEFFKFEKIAEKKGFKIFRAEK